MGEKNGKFVILFVFIYSWDVMRNVVEIWDYIVLL